MYVSTSLEEKWI